MFLDALRRVPEQAHVGAHRDDLAAHRHIALGVCLHGSEYAARFSSGLGSLEDTCDSLLHIRMIWITKVSVRSR
jgi:hypothetical protein